MYTRARFALAVVALFTMLGSRLPAIAVVSNTLSANAMKRWAATMGGPQTVTREQALRSARNFDVIVGHPRTFEEHVAAMRAENPGLRFIAYMNGAYARDSEGSAYAEDLYLRSADGRKVQSSKHGNYLMNVRDRRWVNDVSRECAADTAPGGWDGCYLDMLGPGTLTPGYVTHDPIDPATGAVWTKPDWIAATSALASRVQADHPGLFILANGLGTGKQYFSPEWGPTSRLLQGAQGGNAQGFVRGTDVPVDQFRKEDQWKNEVDMLVSAGNRGRSVFTMTKIWGVPATSAQKDAVHRFTLATFLLGTDGNQFFFWSDDGDQGADPQRHRYDDVDVGQPQGPYARSADGAYTRPFTNAVVVVNPGETTVRVELGSVMTSLDGDAVSSVVLAPHTGDVFTR
jgi:hypothetical protein